MAKYYTNVAFINKAKKDKKMTKREVINRSNRRKHVRVDVYAVTRYFCAVRDKEVGVQTRISDISEGGAKLLTFEEGIPVDTIVSMSFRLPHQENVVIKVEGMVRYSGFVEQDLFRTGVEFTKMRKKDIEVIREYVYSRTR
ncbi:MAG: Flagellar brake protein YcgR [Candidatus Omnitrophica bacterium ADurb.Bin292]|nr:MAG: Flagellar brake protein YcgR [Candidatus Omnitrophica bacterium ADurb.Bin292]